MDEELKKVIADLGKTTEEYRKSNDQQIAELKKGVDRSDLESKLSKLSDKLTALESQKAALEAQAKSDNEAREELERKFNKLRVGAGDFDLAEGKSLLEFNLQVKSLARERGAMTPGDVDLEGMRAYKAAFQSWMRKGNSISADEQKAMYIGSEADGGFIVTPDHSGQIVKRVYELTPIRQLCNVQTISTDALEGIEDLGEASAGWVGEQAARTDTNTPQINKWRIPVHEMYAQPSATQKLLDDANVNVEQWLADKVADKFARTEAGAYVTGTGSLQPRGLTTYLTAATADATRAWGTFERKGTGVSGDFAASSPADILFDLIQAFKPYYLSNAKWVMPRAVIAKIRKFKEATTNAYMWQPGLQAGQPAQLLGYPIVNSEDMPALGSNSLSVAFGDFKSAYTIVERAGIRTLRDPFTNKPFVRFYTTRRVGGGAVNFEAVKFVYFG